MGESAKTGDVALRLVLLALLLLGVGVLHTLSHAGAQGGVAASAGVEHSDHVLSAGSAEAAVCADAARAYGQAVEQTDPHQHIKPVDDVEVSGCFATVPAGFWLVPPRSLATWSGGVGADAIRAGPSPDVAADMAGSRSQVLRI